VSLRLSPRSGENHEHLDASALLGLRRTDPGRGGRELGRPAGGVTCDRRSVGIHTVGRKTGSDKVRLLAVDDSMASTHAARRSKATDPGASSPRGVVGAASAACSES
jgi:hypothetical protein